MKQDHRKPTSKGRKALFIACAIFSFVAAVGQVAYLFIPSFTGDSPQTTSIFGTILWPGLFFLSLWALWGRNKALGFLTGAFVGLILYAGADAVTGYKQAEADSIEQAVSASNDQLPRMIDERTRMDSVSIDQDAKVYSIFFSLVDLRKSQADISEMNRIFADNTTQNLCNLEQLGVFFSEGYSIDLVYQDRNGDVITSYTVSPADCD